MQRSALRAWEEATDFRALVEAEPEFAERVLAERIAEAFDLDAALQHADVIFERLSALSPGKEPVHA